MFYTIYKITNLIDGKIYIGKHQTKDLNDSYMGSGKFIRRAIDKHGIENFKKEILFQFDSEADMNAKEAELVTEELCLREDTYNLCVGGKGGFSYINSNDLGKRPFRDNAELQKLACKAGASTTNNRLKSDRELYDKWRKSFIGRDPTFLGKNHSDETKKKIGKANSKMIGSKNSQFGTMWITNGQENKKIRKDVDVIPEGWYKGRKK